MNQTPRWRPISDLSVLASILDSMLHDDEGQYRTLCECRPKPYVLDDHTVGRVIEVFTQQKADLAYLPATAFALVRGQSHGKPKAGSGTSAGLPCQTACIDGVHSCSG